MAKKVKIPEKLFRIELRRRHHGTSTFWFRETEALKFLDLMVKDSSYHDEILIRCIENPVEEFLNPYFSYDDEEEGKDEEE